MERNLDLSRIRFHDLRSTSATLFIQASEHPNMKIVKLLSAPISG